MKIAFSPPFIDNCIEEEVLDVLRSGWITSGPKVKELEEKIEAYTGTPASICVNSWTSGAIMMLKWWGIGPGDEIILPAYTYAATALAILHCGAKPVMVDIDDNFLIDENNIEQVITEKTKAIIAVDIGGWPANYTALLKILEKKKEKFSARNNRQKLLGRVLLISDAAHSFGATYNNLLFNPADIIIYSFHAVKNLTTAEGGAICLNLPIPFENKDLKPQLKQYSLNGQTKDAFTKSKAGDWRYDITELGFKFNMPDINAAIGLAQFRKYDKIMLERLRVFKRYQEYFSKVSWAIVPKEEDEIRKTSAHLYMLRIKNIDEFQRDTIITEITEKEVSVNVHFIPLPMLTLFKNLGYIIEDYPNAYKQYACEISLPVYPQLSDDEVDYVIETVVNSVKSVTGFYL